jgi:hypothetical protein
MKNFNKRLFKWILFCYGVLLIPSYLAAWAMDEGHASTGGIWFYFEKLFLVLRFPTHTFFWPLVDYTGGWFFPVGLTLNGILYGLLVERLFSLRRVVQE